MDRRGPSQERGCKDQIQFFIPQQAAISKQLSLADPWGWGYGGCNHSLNLQENRKNLMKQIKKGKKNEKKQIYIL